jgi:hypothetical protein
MSDKILNNVHIDFVEYDLNNGLHVILHQDNTSSFSHNFNDVSCRK